MKGKLLIIDANNWSHRAYNAMARLTYNGKPMGMIWGFINILITTVKTTRPDKVIACWDDGRNKHRLALLPDYKKREQKIGFDVEDFLRQKKVIMLMLKCMGVAQCIEKGKEADDWIYQLTQEYLKWNIVIGSGDKDFRQLVCKRITLMDNNKGRITPINFEKLFIIKPEQYADFLCLDGDASDKIPGVPGVGEKTAIKLLQEHGSIRQFLGNGKNVNHPKYTLIKEVYKINRPLINLSVFYQRFGPFDLAFYKDKRKPKKNYDKYKTLCLKYGVKKFREVDIFNLIP